MAENTPGDQMRLSLIGPTGSGKTTSAWLLQRLVPGAALLSVAEPLRDLEQHVYAILRRPYPGRTGSQDGELLQQVRALLLGRDPDVLASRFRDRVAMYAAHPLLVNDDCRRASKAVLDDLSFKYVWVDGAHTEWRRDATPARPSELAHDAVIDRAECDFLLENHGTIADLIENLEQLLENIQSPDIA